jgi:UDP-N-acetylglucosamine 4,6-dehydratase/5-epimerase
MSYNLQNCRILVTGGTGSFGKRFVETLFQKFPNIERVVIYSRDELKQFEMAQLFPPEKYPAIRFFIGDVRDRDRLKRAMEGVDTVVHAAALKQVPAAEYNPFEAIRTNVIGAQNVIEAAMDSGIKRVVALSTDKAAAPINLYGATKLCSDKLFIAANNLKGKRDLRFSVVRYGNVMGSRGSVIPFFLDRRNSGVLPITDPNMTRFSISLDEGVDMVLYTLQHSIGGEILVPKIPSYRITDLAEAIGPDCEKPVVGIRPGEKLHEEMVTSSDSQNTIENDRYYVIVPMLHEEDHNKTMATFMEHHSGRPVEAEFRYSSDKNDKWLGVDELRQLICEHVDPAFKVS